MANKIVCLSGTHSTEWRAEAKARARTLGFDTCDFDGPAIEDRGDRQAHVLTLLHPTGSASDLRLQLIDFKSTSQYLPHLNVLCILKYRDNNEWSVEESSLLTEAAISFMDNGGGANVPGLYDALEWVKAQ